jgi:hypothetical protein
LKAKKSDLIFAGAPLPDSSGVSESKLQNLKATCSAAGNAMLLAIKSLGTYFQDTCFPACSLRFESAPGILIFKQSGT